MNLSQQDLALLGAVLPANTSATHFKDFRCGHDDLARLLAAARAQGADQSPEAGNMINKAASPREELARDRGCTQKKSFCQVCGYRACMYPVKAASQPATNEQARCGLNDLWPGDPYPVCGECLTCSGAKTITVLAGTAQPEQVWPCPTCVGWPIPNTAITAPVKAASPEREAGERVHHVAKEIEAFVKIIQADKARVDAGDAPIEPGAIIDAVNAMAGWEKELREAEFEIDSNFEALEDRLSLPVQSVEGEPVAKMADALENLLIAVGMGWDLDGIVDVVRDTIAEQSGIQFIGEVSKIVAARYAAPPKPSEAPASEIRRLVDEHAEYVRGEKINRTHIVRAASVLASRVRSLAASTPESASKVDPATMGDVSSLIAARCSALPGALIDCPVCGAVDKERARLAVESADQSLGDAS